MKKYSIDIVIPTYNEEKTILKTITVLHKFCIENFKLAEWKIIVGDNGSNDKTVEIALQASKNLKNVIVKPIKQKGRGRAVLNLWKSSNADVCMYMDADLSTDIKHIPETISKIVDEGYDLVVGSRNMRGSDVQNRTLKREIISKCYMLLLKLTLGIKVSDAQCGFKAISKKARKIVLPFLNPDNWSGSAWFFDTELIAICEKIGLKVKDIPVKWVDDRGSTVNVVKDAVEDIRGIVRLLRTRPWKKIKYNLN